MAVTSKSKDVALLSVSGIALTLAFVLGLTFFMTRWVDVFPFDLFGTDVFLFTHVAYPLLLVLLYVRSKGGAAAIAIVAMAVLKQQADFRVDPVLKCGDGGCKTIVTGANSGIGYGLAHELAKQGHEVVLGCRSESKCKVAVEKISAMGYPGNAISAPGLDLNSLAKTKAWAKKIASYNANYFFANAGFLPVANKTTEDGFEAGWGVMVLGHHALIKWGLANKMISPSASVVMVSSEAQRLGAIHKDISKDIRGEVTIGCGTNPSPICMPPVSLQAEGIAPAGRNNFVLRFPWNYLPESMNPNPSLRSGFGSYARSKLSDLLIARELRRRVPTLTKVSSVHPGMVDTNLADVVVETMFAQAGGGLGKALLRMVHSASVAVRFALLRTPQQAGRIVMNAALAGPTDSAPFFCGRGEAIPEDLAQPHMKDDDSAKKMYDIMEDIVRHL